MRHSRPGHNLIELLIVIAIVGILLALVAVAVNRVRESSNRVVCLNNLRQLALAVHNYNDAKKELPPYSALTPAWPVFGGWWVYLMPYAEQQSFYNKLESELNPIKDSHGRYSYTYPVERNANQDVHFELLTCPSDPSLHTGRQIGTSNYLANWFVFGNGIKGCYGPPQKLFRVEQGYANIVLFAEGYSHCNEQIRPALTVCCSHNFGITPLYLPSDDPSYLPNDYTMFQIRPRVNGEGGCDGWRTQTAHDAMPVAWADGGARFLASDISPSLWKSLIKYSDAAVAPVD
jgi:type II secretory pathway pseudopilin PulG